ncbi:hypothetical protein [Streptomyces sp. NPDC102476]|uniref:hypothetical protein n=1 Tax=Streptomyces sp. NPDC102476 TaxID=3366181 RepID=UPI00380BFD35
MVVEDGLVEAAGDFEGGVMEVRPATSSSVRQERARSSMVGCRFTQEACPVCQALDFELLPKHIERTRAKMKRLVTLGILTESEPGTFQHEAVTKSGTDINSRTAH